MLLAVKVLYPNNGRNVADHTEMSEFCQNVFCARERQWRQMDGVSKNRRYVCTARRMYIFLNYIEIIADSSFEYTADRNI